LADWSHAWRNPKFFPRVYFTRDSSQKPTPGSALRKSNMAAMSALTASNFTRAIQREPLSSLHSCSILSLHCSLTTHLRLGGSDGQNLNQRQQSRDSGLQPMSSYSCPQPSNYRRKIFSFLSSALHPDSVRRNSTSTLALVSTM
jgi:hypothetical protein